MDLLICPPVHGTDSPKAADPPVGVRCALSNSGLGREATQKYPVSKLAVSKEKREEGFETTMPLVLPNSTS